jgi:hypothetical protein
MINGDFDQETRPGRPVERAARGLEQRPVLALGAIFLLGLLARVLTAAFTYCVSTDSIHFLEMAERMVPLTREALRAGVDHHVFHPAYPLLMAFTHRLVEFGLDRCGQIVSVVFGTLTLLPLFAIARHVFGTLPALCATLLLAVNPEHLEHSGDVMSEATFLFFVLACVALAIPALLQTSRPAAFGAGASAGLAYLVRPEGGAPLLVLCLALLVGLRRRRAAAGCLLIAVFGFTLFAGPYLAHLSFVDGSFKPEITLKKPFWDHEPRGEPRIHAAVPPRSVRRARAAEKERESFAAQALHEYSASVYYVALVFIAIGVPRSVARRGELGAGTPLLTGVLAVALVVALGVFENLGYLSSRHLLTFTILTLLWAGYGMVEAGRWLHAKLGLRRLSVPATVAAIAVFAAALHGPKVLQPQRWDRLGERSAALVLRKEGKVTREDYVFTPSSRALYYAGLEASNRIAIRDSRRLSHAEIRRVAALTNGRARFVLIPYKDGFRELIDGGEYARLELLYHYGQEQQEAEYGITRELAKKRWIFLYEVPQEENHPGTR